MAAARLVAGEDQEAVHVEDLPVEAHPGAEAVSVEALREVEGASVLLVEEVGAIEMYHMVDKYSSCIHEAFGDTQDKREMGRLGSAFSPGQFSGPPCTKLLEGEEYHVLGFHTTHVRLKLDIARTANYVVDVNE